ncbi:MAG: hypothetical protein U0414_12165 [Polyangiaceae bacterium]
MGFDDDQHEHIGTLSMFLERTYFVELARRDERATLDEAARAFSFDGVTPRFLRAGGRHVLALGPFDRDEADRVFEQARANTPPARADGLRIDAGDGYEDAW